MSITLDILNMKGEKVGSYELADNLLEFEKGEQAVHDAVVSFQNCCRAGTASTKTRGEVAGSGKKPFKQKGLGRARAGSARNPVWRHGGQIFGPKPRSYETKINAKVRALALKRTFSERAKEAAVIVLENFALAEKKTKLAAQAFKAVKAEGRILCAVKDYNDENFLYATDNIPTVNVLCAGTINPYEILRADKLVFSKDSLDEFVKRIG